MIAHLSVYVLIKRAPVPELTEKKEKYIEKKKKRIDDEEIILERCERAMNMILLNVEDHVLRKIEKCVSATHAWAVLKRLYM